VEDVGVQLTLLDSIIAICRLPADAPVPDWASGEFVSVTRSAEELSVTCADDEAPAEVTADRGWRCLKVEGPLDLTLTGIASALTTPLAEAGVSVSVIATYDTDYLLVKGDKLTQAIAALEAAGHTVA
jgi:hypothetical protein